MSNPPLRRVDVQGLLPERPVVIGPRVGRPIRFTVLGAACAVDVHWSNTHGVIPHYGGDGITCPACEAGAPPHRPRGYVHAGIHGRRVVGLVELPHTGIRALAHVFAAPMAYRGHVFEVRRVGPNANSRVVADWREQTAGKELDALPAARDPVEILMEYWGIKVEVAHVVIPEDGV